MIKTKDQGKYLTRIGEIWVREILKDGTNTLLSPTFLQNTIIPCSSQANFYLLYYM
jgi:hypothetical protein